MSHRRRETALPERGTPNEEQPGRWDRIRHALRRRPSQTDLPEGGTPQEKQPEGGTPQEKQPGRRDRIRHALETALSKSGERLSVLLPNIIGALFWWLVIAVILGLVAVVPSSLAMLKSGSVDTVKLTTKGELLAPAVAIYFGGMLTLVRKPGGPRWLRYPAAVFSMLAGIFACVYLGMLFNSSDQAGAGPICWQFFVGSVVMSCFCVVLSEL
jgi:hypothetical protein